MKITATYHAMDQCIDRINKIKDRDHSKKYLENKFRRLISGQGLGKNKGDEVILKAHKGRKILKNRLHTFIYTRVENSYKIITYYLNRNYVNKFNK